MNKLRIFIAVAAVIATGCDESKRFEIGYADSKTPAPPVYLDRYTALNGGAVLYFKAPADDDLLSIDATYVNPNGKEMWFSVSYYVDSITVTGFADNAPKDVYLFAVDRAGNRSEKIKVVVAPLPPAITTVAASIRILPGFESFLVNWENEKRENLIVYVDYTITDGGSETKEQQIYTSNKPTERNSVRVHGDKVSATIRIEDIHGNSSGILNMGTFALLHDEAIPKANWTIPDAGSAVITDKSGEINTGVPMDNFNWAEGHDYMLIDGVTYDAEGNNAAVTAGNKWNYIIDLGGYYELSRIVTHQRSTFNDFWNDGYGVPSSEFTDKMNYYGQENISTYRLWFWNEEIRMWEPICTHRIARPPFGTQEELYVVAGQEGDVAYLYPDEPQFSPSTRWFRYEAIDWFAPSQRMGAVNGGKGYSSLTEITLYGKKTP